MALGPIIRGVFAHMYGCTYFRLCPTRIKLDKMLIMLF
jgi:hypothetical protein